MIAGFPPGTPRDSYALVGPIPGPNVGDVVNIPMLSGGMYGIAVEADGKTALIAEYSGELSRVDLTTGQVSTIAFVDLGGIASPGILPGGGSAVVITAPGGGGGASGLKRVNLVTGEVTTIVDHGISHGGALAIEPGGATALVTGLEGGLVRVDLATGSISGVSGIGGFGLAIEPSGTTALVATGFARGFGERGPFDCSLVRVDLTTGGATTVAGLACFFPPMGVAIEPGGATALVTTPRYDVLSGQIVRVDLVSGAVTLLTGCPVCGWPQVVMEPSGNTALFLGDGNTSLLRLDRLALTQTVLAGSESPVGMAMSREGGTAVTVSYSPGFGFSGRVSRVHLLTGQVDRVANTEGPSGGVALDATGTTAFITASSFNAAHVQKIDLSTGTVSNVATWPVQLTDLAIEGSGTTALVVVNDGKSLLRVDLVSGNINIISDQLLSPEAVAIEHDGISALVAEASGNTAALARVDLQTGTVTRIVTGLGPVAHIAMEPDGVNALIAGVSSNLVAVALSRINLTTKAVTTLTSGPFCANGSQFSGIAVEAGGETALLSHPVCGVLRVRILPADEQVPVVLVHGWCGSPNESTWGQMLSLLKPYGLHGDYAQYSTNTEPDLAKLAGHLKSEVHRVLADTILNPSVATQVDVVAHSMGGLVTKAWIAGIAVDAQGQSVPYNNEVRRLIMVATPHYGVPFSTFEAELFFPCSASKGARTNQERQMEFGSNFVWVLHQKWVNTPFAHARKQDLLTIVGTGLNPFDTNDGVVPVPSATLSDPDVRARYVDRGHFSSIVKVADAEHETFKLVKSFLLASDPSSPEADECNAPTCRRDLGATAPGMILMRLVNKNGNGINLHHRCVFASILPSSCPEYNPEASAVTIDDVDPGVYDITVEVDKNFFGVLVSEYGPTTVTGARINPARTTVPAEVILQKSK